MRPGLLFPSMLFAQSLQVVICPALKSLPCLPSTLILLKVAFPMPAALLEGLAPRGPLCWLDRSLLCPRGGRDPADVAEIPSHSQLQTSCKPESLPIRSHYPGGGLPTRDPRPRTGVGAPGSSGGSWHHASPCNPPPEPAARGAGFPSSRGLGAIWKVAPPGGCFRSPFAPSLGFCTGFSPPPAPSPLFRSQRVCS